MDIKTVFERIAKEYPEAKKQKLKNHPLTKFIRTEVPKSFREDLGETISKYKVMVAKHAGNWSRVAWIVISDTRVTESAARGYYPVYSFFENGKKIMLSLGQGYKDIKTKYKKEAALNLGLASLKKKMEKFKKMDPKDVRKQVLDEIEEYKKKNK